MRERLCNRRRVSLSLSLSDLLTHTTVLHLHPAYSDWNHGRWGAANWKAERCWSEACLFSLSDKNINFQHELKPLIGASMCCWDDEGFGKTTKLKSLRSSSRDLCLPMLRKLNKKVWNGEENAIIVEAHTFFCLVSLPPCFCFTFYLAIYLLARSWAVLQTGSEWMHSCIWCQCAVDLVFQMDDVLLVLQDCIFFLAWGWSACCSSARHWVLVSAFNLGWN